MGPTEKTGNGNVSTEYRKRCEGVACRTCGAVPGAACVETRMEWVHRVALFGVDGGVEYLRDLLHQARKDDAESLDGAGLEAADGGPDPDERPPVRVTPAGYRSAGFRRPRVRVPHERLCELAALRVEAIASELAAVTHDPDLLHSVVGTYVLRLEAAVSAVRRVADAMLVEPVGEDGFGLGGGVR